MDDFREIDHCGGVFSITTCTDENGNLSYQLGVTQRAPKPFSIFAVKALPQGIACATVDMGQMTLGRDSAELDVDTFLVFFASDTTGAFGRLCPNCKGYWRTSAVPALWNMTCPYCGTQARAHAFLTDGQQEFVRKCCEHYSDALHNREDGTYEIDLDTIADEIAKGAERPKFFYAEESQQCRYRCDICRAYNDILGKFGFCCCCAARNNITQICKDFDKIKGALVGNREASQLLRDVVSAIDSYAADLVKVLSTHVPTSKRRKKLCAKFRFHDLDRAASDLLDVFDIHILKGEAEEDIAFARKMFLRRHVHEHSGSVADAKYLSRSGDSAVRLGQVIHESRASIERFIDLLLRMAINLDKGFKEIFPVNPDASRILGLKVR